MLNVTHVLEHIGIDMRSVSRAIQDASSIVRESPNPLHAARKMFQDVLSVEERFEDEVYARVCCAKMIELVVRANGEVADELVMVASARSYAKQFCDDPKHSYLWARSETPTTVATTSIQVVNGIDVKVAVKADGKIKKGGKQILALELYKKKVLEATAPLNNQQFIALLMKELDMSKAGATTYSFNLKRDHGAPEGFTGKRGRHH